MRRMLSTATILAACAATAACGRSDVADELVREKDPALSRALAAPITIDPDLAGMNRANSAASLPPQHGYLPTIDSGPETVAAARADAVALVGGADRMRPAPEPAEAADALPPAARLTAATLAAEAPGGYDDCAGRARYTMQWAARMPAAFPVYPRAAVQEAAGTDADDCSLRVVRFVTPVPVGDVIDFYFSLAGAAGYTAKRVRQGNDDRLAGEKGAASFVVYARRLPSGHTEIDLVTGG